MAFRQNIEPHIVSIFQEIPAPLQDEVRDAVAYHFEWELWRTSQDPIVEDTPANRAQFAKVQTAKWVGNGLRDWVVRFRTDAAAVAVDGELDA